MPTTAATAPGKDEQIRLRLLHLAKDHPQAEIARRLGLSRSTVNAYFKGSKVPASFLGSLVDEFKLNPVWLLTGEGTPWLADVSQGASRMAGDMLEVVRAMQSVAQMRLGALLGRDHLKALRALNAQFADYDALRARLSLAAEPVLREIVDRLGATAQKQSPKAMLESVAAGTQISRFVADEALVIEFDRLCAWHLYRSERFAESLALMNRVIFRALVSGKPLDNRFADQAHDYIFLLTNRWRMREARRLTRAVISLLEPLGPSSTGVQALLLKSAQLDVELGDLQAGMRGVREHLLATNGKYETSAHRWSIHWAMLCAGFVTVEDCITLCDNSFSWLNMAMRLIGFIDDARLVEKIEAVQIAVGDKSQPAYIEMLRHRIARWRRANQQHDPSAAAEAFEETANESKSDPELNTARRFARAAEATRLARAAGDRNAAMHYLREAEHARFTTPPEVTHGLHLLAEHFRNILELAAGGNSGISAEMRAEASNFFRDHHARGYLIFGAIAGRLTG